MPKIECVIVSVDYADFLAWTLPFNKIQFDNIIVVTSVEDVKTQKLCEYWHVRCIKSNAWKEGGGGFNKGKLINVGLEAIEGDDWVVHMDADIYLPPHFRRVFDCMVLDKDSLYTMDRMMCRNFGEWIRFLMQPKVQHENNIFIHDGPFPLGVRLASTNYGGYLPIGFFQCWNQGQQNLLYPIEHTTAARADLQFTLNFPRDKRNMMAECIAIHLETIGEKGMGNNWSGRKTPIFGQELLDEVAN